MYDSTLWRTPQNILAVFEQMDRTNLLCFACSCAERLAPLASHFWIEEYVTHNRTTIDLCWRHCVEILQNTSGHIATDYPSIVGTKTLNEYGFDMIMINQIYHELQNVPDEKLAIDSLLGDPFATSYYMSEFVRSSDIKSVVACTQRTYNAADWLACELVGYNQDRGVGEDKILASVPMQMEIDKLDRDLKLLRREPLTANIVREICQDSIRVGKEFMQYIDEYLRTSNTG